jgi:hypothetical protein
MGNQAAACQIAVATQPNQSVNDGTNVFNICPRGWRLPTSLTATTGDFGLLNVAINAGNTGSDAGLLSQGLFMRSGRFSSGTFGGTLDFASYWSSTVVDAINVRDLTHSSTLVNPAINRNRGNGLSVRCVAP